MSHTLIAFQRLMKANLNDEADTDYRYVIATTVVDLIDMGCDPATVHNAANLTRIHYGLPTVHPNLFPTP